jgi:hypothetical protein
MNSHHRLKGLTVSLEDSVRWTRIAPRRLAVMVAVAVLTLTASTANAQMVSPNSAAIINPAFRVVPHLTLSQFAFNNAVTAAAIAQYPPWAFGYNPYSGYGAYGYGAGSYLGGYGSGYNPFSAGATGYGATGYGSSPYDPYGGSDLRGIAEITAAQGKFAVSIEESKMTREKRRQSEIETRRKIFDEWQYERGRAPTLEDFRNQDRSLARRRALNDPPLTEILSATALNTLLDHLKSLQGSGASGARVAIDEGTLKRINITPGTGGNFGLLKNDGRLTWPLPLQDENFRRERDAISKDVPTLVQQAAFGNGVDPGMLNTTKKNLDVLQEKLAKNVREIGTSQYIESKRFLNLVNDGLQTLSNNDVATYFNRDFAAKCKTTAELVKYMADKGLKFAPSTPGDEAAYRALHQGLATYDLSLTQSVAEKDR